jgi:hypothetical protein
LHRLSDRAIDFGLIFVKNNKRSRMSSSDREAAPEFRIMPAGLTKADLLRLEVFVGVRSDRLRNRWSVVSQAPVDVYIHDADDPPTIPGCLPRTPVQIRITDAARQDDDVTLLTRPLQFDAFVEALSAAEHLLARPAAVAPARAVPAAAPVSVPASSAETVATRSTPALLAGGRFRLRRWPGAGLLQSSRYGMRMASFMSARFLSVRELAHLSGVEEEECARFVSTLIDSTLLRQEPLALDEPQRVAAVPGPSAAPEATLALRAARPGRTLLSSLRSKLGLGTGGR